MRSGWTALKRDAGLITSEPSPEEGYFSRRFADLLHVDEPRRLDLMSAVGAASRTQTSLDAGCDPLMVQMLAYQIDGRREQVGGPDAFIARLSKQPEIGAELEELSGMLQVRSTLKSERIPGLEDLPLCLHAAYGIREILTAVGWLTATRRVPFQAGRLPLESRQTELLFVTLDKSEGYHERIAYHDYAISTERFHWQSQNSAGPDTPVGKRYLKGADSGWQFQLFVRTRRGEPYRACGPVAAGSVEGDRPMTIVWKLERPLPVRLFREFSVLRGI